MIADVRPGPVLIAYDDALEGSIVRGVLTLRIPLSTARVANRVDIREPQREPEATALTS